mmetsp:Transcript_40463/g.84182  ORF Transcript_40463/g.84182 Transcript_40463/m.84182 type:complete len:511 (-) Transcript_40463:2424-3956(-)
MRHSVWGRVSPTTLLSHHWVSTLLRNSTSTRAPHHLGHHGVSRLHTSSRARALHVHWHARVSHRSAHRSTHHAWLARSARASTGGMLGFQLGTSDFTALGNSNKNGLVSNKLAVHFVDSTSGFFRSGEANKTKSTRTTILHILHDTSRSDSSHSSKFIAKHIIRHGIVQVFHVKVDALELGDAVHFLGLKLGTKFALAFRLFLSTAHVEFLFRLFAVDGRGEFSSVQVFDSSGSRFVLGKVDETISQTGDLFFPFLVGILVFLRLSFRSFSRFLFSFGSLTLLFFLGGSRLLLRNALGNRSADNFSKLFKFCHETSIVPLQRNILDVDVSPRVDIRAIVTAHKVPNLNFLSIDEHAVQLINGGVGSFGSFIVNVSVPFGFSVLAVRHDLTRKNVSKEGESIVKLLVVNGFVQVFDKNVANSRFTKGRITLTPHDTARLSLDHGKVHGIQRTFRISKLVKVHIGVTKGATSDSVTAHTNGGHRTNSTEDLVQERLVDIRGQVSNVKRRGME